mgnify:CR=1 FL=1
MLLDVIYSICFNICLLVVLAFMMTKMDFVQRLLLNEEGGSEEGRGESVWQRRLGKGASRCNLRRLLHHL